MAEQEEVPPLRSLDSNEPTYVEFVNKSNCKARAWWLNFTGAPVSYGDIRPGQSLRMNTFLTHPWVFRASDGSELLADSCEVYFPSPAECGEDGAPQFRTVVVTAPVYTLQEYCSKLIRKVVRREDVDKLEIPTCLREHVSRAPDLLKELQLLRARRMES